MSAYDTSCCPSPWTLSEYSVAIETHCISFSGVQNSIRNSIWNNFIDYRWHDTLPHVILIGWVGVYVCVCVWVFCFIATTQSIDYDNECIHFKCILCVKILKYWHPSCSYSPLPSLLLKTLTTFHQKFTAITCRNAFSNQIRSINSFYLFKLQKLKKTLFFNDSIFNGLNRVLLEDAVIISVSLWLVIWPVCISLSVC